MDQPSTLSESSSVAAPAAPASERIEWRRHAWKLVVGLLFIYNLITFVPWVAQLPRAELDASWSMVLHWAWLNGADFGRDLAFTYGPWGFAFQGYHPNTFVLATFISSLAVVPAFYCIYRIAMHMTPTRWIAGLWMLLVISLAANSFQGLSDIRLLIIPWSTLLIYFFLPGRDERRTEIIALACVLAFLSQVKFTMFIQSMVVLGAITTDQLLRRQMVWPLLAFFFSALFFWLLAGQRIAALLPYVKNSWAVSSGYTEGCGAFSSTEGRDVLLYLLFALLLLGVAAMSQWSPIESTATGASRWKRMLQSVRGYLTGRRVELIRAVLLLGSLLATLLLLFKAGFVRHDGHELLATVGGAILLILLAAVSWPGCLNRYCRAFVVVAVLLGLANNWFSQHRWAQQSLPASLWKTVAEVPPRIGSIFATMFGRDPNAERLADLLQTARAIRALPVPIGTVDIYSSTQQSIFANNFNFRPRPVFQSYTAYSARLSRMNADFLGSNRAPDSILFGIQPIDSHFPSMEDSLSWPELLTRYDVVDGAHSHLLLQKAAVPRQYALVDHQTYTVPFRHVVKLPDSDVPVWAKMTLKKNLKARLAGAVYKTPNVYVVAKTQNGIERTYRILPDVAAAGFLLSPLIMNQTQFMMLYSKDFARHSVEDRIAEFAIGDAPGSALDSYYEPEYTLEVFKLLYPRSDISSVPGVMDYLEVKQFLRDCTIAFQQAPVIAHCTEEGHFVSLSAGRTQVLVKPPPGAKRMRIGLGMLQQSYSGAEPADPVEKQVFALAPNGSGGWAGEVIYSRTLDPSHVDADRGYQTVDIKLPDKVFTTIMLETGPDVHRSMSYWSVPRFSAE